MLTAQSNTKRNFLKAKTEFSAGNYEEAYKTLQDSLGENNLPDEFLSLLQEVVAARDESKAKKLSQYMHIGKDALSKEMYQEAFDAFEQAYTIGNSIEKLSPEQVNEILKLKNDAKKKADEINSALQRVGDCLERGEVTEALDLLNNLRDERAESIHQKIKELEHAVNKGQKNFEKKKFKDAITQFKHAKEISPKDDLLEQYLKNSKFELTMQEGNLRYEKRDYRFALKFYEEALGLLPDSESAKQMKQKAQDKWDGKERARQLVNTAKSAKNQGDLVQAVQLLKTALKYDPDSEDAKNILSEIELDSHYAVLEFDAQECLMDGNYAGALKYLRQIHTSPNPDEIKLKIEKISRIQQLEETARTAIGTKEYKHAVQHYDEIKSIFTEYLKIKNVPDLEKRIEDLNSKRSEYIGYLVEELAKQRDAKNIEGAYHTAEKIRSIDENNPNSVQLMNDILRELNKTRVRSSLGQPLNRLEILLGVFTLVLGIILLLTWFKFL